MYSTKTMNLLITVLMCVVLVMMDVAQAAHGTDGAEVDPAAASGATVCSMHCCFGFINSNSYMLGFSMV